MKRIRHFYLGSLKLTMTGLFNAKPSGISNLGGTCDVLPMMFSIRVVQRRHLIPGRFEVRAVVTMRRIMNFNLGSLKLIGKYCYASK